MANNKPHNKKSPEGPQQSKRSKPEYPWVSGSADVNGRHKIIHADPSKPEQSFIEEFNHDGSFTIHETLKDEKGLKNELYHHHRQYGQSKSVHMDGNHDDRAYNRSVVTDKDHGIQSGGNLYEGSLKQKIQSTAQTKKRNGRKGSKQNYFQSTNGDGSIMHEGNHFAFYGKDHGQAVDGSSMTMVSKEYGTYAQGNMDFFSEKKARFASNGALSMTTTDTGLFSTEKAMTVKSKEDMSVSSNSEITIKADTKITIKVGSSKIEISDGNITITGSAINFQQG